MMKRILLLIIYVFLGVFLYFKDPFVIPVYLTTLPFQWFMLYMSLKTKNVVYIMFSIFLFISHGIGPTFFYLDRMYAESVGFGAVGNFDFSYDRLFSAYSYVVVFQLFLWLFVYGFKKSYHYNFIPEFIILQSNKIHSNTSLTWSIYPLLLLSVLFTVISVWMYNLHIGMMGLHQTELPYHLTGILYYSRRFFFPILLLWVFYKTKSKSMATIVLLVYALLAGILSTSKSAALIVLIPIILYNYVTGNKKLSYIGIIASVLIYAVVGTVRNVIYQYDAEIDLTDLMTGSYDFFNYRNGFFVFIINNITGRLYGLQSTVLTDQYTHLSFHDLVSFYTSSKMSEIIPDIPKTLFGIDLPEDKAYGVGFGISGTMQLLSCHNYLYTILQSLWIAIIFVIQNNCAQRIFIRSERDLHKWIALLLVFYSFMEFYSGSTMRLVYITTILLIIFCYSIVNNRHPLLKQRVKFKLK